MRAVQLFSDDYLARCQAMSADEIVKFLEDFRQLQSARTARSRLISLKIPEDLLSAFRTKAELNRMPYQTQIKQLMKAWLLE